MGIWLEEKERKIRGRLVCQLKTQCSVFKHWTLVSKWQKYMFGLSVQNTVVWKLLPKNQCLNNMFWNVAGGDFKQWTHVSDGNYVINLNTFTQLFLLLMGPLTSFFFNFVSSPLYCHLISPLFFVLSRLKKKKNFVHMISFFYKNKHTYQTYFLYFLNAETRYLNYDTKHFFFF